MLITIISVSVGVTLILASGLIQARMRRQQRVLASARQAGLAIDENGNIHASATYAAMACNEEESGDVRPGKKSQFMELMRICSEGPSSIDEIRFLFDEGIDPVVRPDGLVYVPCLENQHLYMEGEIELQEEDLDCFIKRQAIKLGVTPVPLGKKESA